MDISKDLLDLFESDSDGTFNPPQKKVAPSADDRLIESFVKILEFVEHHDRMPDINAANISEAVVAQRLEAIRSNPDKVAKLSEVDSLGLLVPSAVPKTAEELFESDDFGLFEGPANSVLDIKNVPVNPRKPAESIAKRKRAEDFDVFEAGFKDVQQDLSSGLLKLVRYVSVDQLAVGSYYVHDGIMLKIVDAGEKKRVYDRNKERFRVVYENGSESNMYRRSLSQRLYENGFAVVAADYAGGYPDQLDDDVVKGYIYVLKSDSTQEDVLTIKNLHKIGFTTGSIEQRIKDAQNDPTYLMAPVELVARYVVTGDYNTQKIEHFLHRIFADAAVNLTIFDKAGKEYSPKEWYSVPLHVVEQAINLLHSGDIVDFVYDTDRNALVGRSDT